MVNPARRESVLVLKKLLKSVPCTNGLVPLPPAAVQSVSGLAGRPSQKPTPPPPPRLPQKPGVQPCVPTGVAVLVGVDVASVAAALSLGARAPFMKRMPIVTA